MTDVGAAMAAVEVLAVDRHSPVETAEAHGDCANCGADLTGPYCAQCGQKGHLHTRLRDLAAEVVEGVVHADGRLWRTLPVLASNPGRLSREWREGRRVRFLQPLHLFLFAVFLFFTLPTLTGKHLVNLPTPAEAAAVGEAGKAAQAESGVVVRGDDPTGQAISRMINSKLSHGDYYAYKIESLAYKLSFLLAPMSLAILALLMAFKRGFTAYDHGVVALYGIGFALLVAAALNLIGWLVGLTGFQLWDGVGLLAMLGLCVHAVIHLRGAYGLSWPGAVLRGAGLGVLTSVAFAVFIVGVAALGLFT